MASSLEIAKKAKEAFVDDSFKLAVDLFSEAIDLSPNDANLFADRAQAHLKLNNLTGTPTHHYLLLCFILFDKKFGV